MNAQTLIVHHPIPAELQEVLRSAGYQVARRQQHFTTFERAKIGGPPAEASRTGEPAGPADAISTPTVSWADPGAVGPLAVSPRQAAVFLNVGHDLVYQLLYAGKIRSVKLGRRRLIPVSDLVRFLEQETS